MTNREEANKLASKITGETVNAGTTKEALEAIGGKSAGSMAEALENIVQGDIPSGGGVYGDFFHVTTDTDGYFDDPSYGVLNGQLPNKNATYRILWYDSNMSFDISNIFQNLFETGVVFREEQGNYYIDVSADYRVGEGNPFGSNEHFFYVLQEV